MGNLAGAIILTIARPTAGHVQQNDLVGDIRSAHLRKENGAQERTEDFLLITHSKSIA